MDALPDVPWLPEFLDKLLAQVDYIGAGALSKAELVAQALRSGKVRGERVDEAELRSMCDRVLARLSPEDDGRKLGRAELQQAICQFAAETGDSAREVLEELLLGSTLTMYFAYGANMSAAGLAAKGITPISSRRAILKDHRLSFSLAVIISKIDPSFANIVECPGEEVHGVAIAFDDKDMATMDSIEGSYERHPIKLHTYQDDGGEVFTGVAYFFNEEIRLRLTSGLTEYLRFEERPTSQRYLNVLVGGATKMELDPAYIEKLKGAETMPLPDLTALLTDELRARIEKRTYTMEEVEASTAEGAKGPVLTCLKGVVCEVFNPFFIKLYGGRDITMFQCLRVRALESLDEMGDDHKEWVNASLAELCAFTVEQPEISKVVGVTSAFGTFDW